jgi:hypothetical protein
MSTEAPSPTPQDAILVEFAPRAAAPHALAEAVGRMASEIGAPPIGVRAYQAVSEPRVSVYLRGAVTEANIADIRALAVDRLRRLVDGELEVSRLEAVRAINGASAGEEAPFRYVVRTDVLPGHERNLENWYDVEHMPSLAAVPGAVLAQRLISLDAAPRYYACYDLVTPAVLQTPPWLAVRATDWSSRVRPTFRDTRRVMSKRLMEVGV